jgi:hypothetical protein
MEIVAFAIGVVVVAVYLIWRGRRGTSTGPDALRKDMPDDLRDKNVGMVGLPNRGRPWGRGN